MKRSTSASTYTGVDAKIILCIRRFKLRWGGSHDPGYGRTSAVRPLDEAPSAHDPEKNRIAPNAVFAVGQVIVSAVTLFFLYRFLLSALGVQALGVWSIVVAATSIASVSGMGLAGGSVRFVSKYLALESEPEAASAVETAMLSVAVVMGLAAFALWPIGSWLVTLVVPAEWIESAQALVPYALAALWLQSIGGTIYSGMDGCHRAGTRGVLTAIVQPTILVLSVWLVPRMGLRGVAIAQLMQYCVWIVLGWILLRRYLPSLPRTPRRWSRRLFFEMWRYGLNFQAISMLTILVDPLAKMLLARYGGLSSVGYFEMANRLVLQVRALLVAANQVLVPYYSKLAETSRDAVRAMYEKNLAAVTLLGVLGFSTLVALLPLISSLWIGHVEQEFLFSGTIISVGILANTLSAPAFFANLGGGWMRRNLFAALAQTIAMVAIGVGGGIAGGSRGVVGGYCLSYIVGSGVTLVMFHRAEGIPSSALFSRAALKTLGLGAAMAMGGFVSYLLLVEWAGSIVAASVSIAVLIAGWSLAVLLVPTLSALTSELRGRARLGWRNIVE